MHNVSETSETFARHAFLKAGVYEFRICLLPRCRRPPPPRPGASGPWGSRVPGGNYSKLLAVSRSEEHTSELQSRFDLVCRLLLEKKKHAKYNFTHLTQTTQNDYDIEIRILR